MNYEEFCNVWIPLGESLLSIAGGMLDSRADAEDALQDLYIKLWRQRDMLDDVQCPAAYAARMLKNMCIDRMRKMKRQAELPPGFDLCDSSSSDVEDIDRVRMVASAIGQLPESQRKVLEMRTLQGLSYEEISKLTGMSQLTLRVLLSRARKTLKQI